MQLNIFAAVAVLCCAFHAAKENPSEGGDAMANLDPNRVRHSDIPLARDNASSSSSSSSSSSLFPFPTGSLLTLQLRQSPGVAVDARRARQRRLSAENNYTYGRPHYAWLLGPLCSNAYCISFCCVLRREQTPLFQGMGVHYSYLWVGTPPQRVSVIIDTGSHHTAFPCVGCKCGKHVCPFPAIPCDALHPHPPSPPSPLPSPLQMDPHFDPAKSSSAVVRDCSGKKCFYRQSYRSPPYPDLPRPLPCPVT